MNVLEIITEYNPFHNGHQVHLNKSITKANADAVICIMSGSLLQRGKPAIVNQWARTKMALKAGVDLVIQLPVVYSCRSAEHFAWGAVKLLDKTNIVNTLCFGSESNNLTPLLTIGELLAEEPPELSHLIKDQLDSGQSYPQALSKAVTKYVEQYKSKVSSPQVKEVLTQANNILGLEYIKALTKLNSSIKPLTIKRIGGSYHQSELNKITSGSAIRQQIKKNIANNQPALTPEIKQALPATSRKILTEELQKGRGPTFISDFTKQLLTLLRRTTAAKLTAYEGVTGGLENRLKTAARQAASLEEFLQQMQTKRFTQTRIQRTIFHLLLDLTKQELNYFNQHNGPQYFRVLGFNQQGQSLLKQLKNNSSLPIITNLSNHYQSNYQPQNPKQKMLAYDLLANDLYNLAYTNEQFKPAGIDFKLGPVINSADN